MLGMKIVSWIFVGVLLFLLVSFLGFVGGPGVLRDVLPNFFVGEEEQVEWDQDFIIENPGNLRLSSNYGGVFFKNYINFRYDENFIFDEPNPCVFGWVAESSDEPFTPDTINYRHEDIDRIEDFTDNERQVGNTIFPLGPEEGLTEIIRYVKSTGEDLLINVGSVETLTYSSDSPKLNDVDLIIHTINRANGDSGTNTKKITERCKLVKKKEVTREAVEIFNKAIEEKFKISDPSLIIIEIDAPPEGGFLGFRQTDKNYYYVYREGADGLKWQTAISESIPEEYSPTSYIFKKRPDHQQKLIKDLKFASPENGFFAIINYASPGSAYRTTFEYPEYPINVYIGDPPQRAATYVPSENKGDPNYARVAVSFLNNKIEDYKNKR